MDLLRDLGEAFAHERHVGELVDGVAGPADRPAGVLQPLADGTESFDEGADGDPQHEPGRGPEDHQEVDRHDRSLRQP